MMQKFMESGYKQVNFNEKADVYVVNTCTVTNMSDKKSRQMLRKTRQQNGEALIVAIGCYAQTNKSELEKMPEIDLVLGNNEKLDIVSYVEECDAQRKKETCITDVMQQKEFVDLGIISYTEKTRAVIKVQDGCDRFCSYCIIPYARGRVRSRQKENILKEIEQIVQKGIKEVVITGIHIASYGKDFQNEYRLIDLLEDINKIEGLKRIRLGSIEPTIITEEFLERLKKLEKVCHHFHLSLQSGCDATLQRMNRKYTTEEFEEIVRLIRKTFIDAILTTDIIVGFPGETEQEFQATYAFLEKIKFFKMHIFKYSPREGTKAAKMQEQISAIIKEERSDKLLLLSDNNEKEILSQYIGRCVEVLFEQKEGEYIKGHTANYIMVKSKDNVKENQIRKVEIEMVEGLELMGKRCNIIVIILTLKCKEK